MAVTQYYGTGRRKTAIARVFLRSGSGKFVVNDKPVDEFFSRETGRMVVRQPLELTQHTSTFDILVNVEGGGESGQAGAVRHGITRALIEYDATLKPALSNAPAPRAKSRARRWACARRAGASSSRSAKPQRLHRCRTKSRLRAAFASCVRAGGADGIPLRD